MNTLKDATQQRALLDAVREIGKELLTIEESRDQIKEILIATSSALEIEKSYIRKVARLYYKKSAASFENETATIKELYQQITTL